MGGIQIRSKDNAHASKYGFIYLQPNSESYYPGDQVTGTVYLELHSRFPGKTIQIALKGKEKIWFQNPANPEKVSSEKSCVFDKTFVLYTESKGEELEAGQYEFPFSFLLPENIPGTFQHVETRLAACVKYSLSASLLAASSDKAYVLRYDRPFLVHDTRMRVEDAASTFPIPVRGCFSCINHGVSIIDIALNKTAYLPSDEVKMRLDINNTKCSRAISSVLMELRHHISLKCNTVTQTRNYVIAQKSTEGTRPYQQPEPKEITFLLPKVPLADPYETFKFEKLRDKALENRDELGCSSNGLLIKSEFFIELTVNFDGLFGENAQKVSVPLQVLHTNFNYPSLETPKGWKPKQSPVKTLPLSANAKYAQLYTSEMLHVEDEYLRQYYDVGKAIEHNDIEKLFGGGVDKAFFENVDCCIKWNNDTALHVAAEYGRIEIFKTLMEKYNANLMIKNKNGELPFHYACREASLEIVEYCIKKVKLRIDLKSDDTWSGLFYAALNNHVKIARYLIGKNALVNLCDKFNRTPCHWAAKFGYFDMCKLLLENGADLTIADRDQKTILSFVDESDSPEFQEKIKTLLLMLNKTNTTISTISTEQSAN